MMILMFKLFVMSQVVKWCQNKCKWGKLEFVCRTLAGLAFLLPVLLFTSGYFVTAVAWYGGWFSKCKCKKKYRRLGRVGRLASNARQVHPSTLWCISDSICVPPVCRLIVGDTLSQHWWSAKRLKGIFVIPASASSTCQFPRPSCQSGNLTNLALVSFVLIRTWLLPRLGD